MGDDYAMRPPARPVLFTALVALAGCGSGGGGSSPPTTLPPNSVVVANFVFTPDPITVPAGTTVTWVFEQPDAPHNVVSTTSPQAFNSGVPQGKGTFTHAFTAPGSYPYICLVHPQMKGTVIVTP